MIMTKTALTLAIVVSVVRLFTTNKYNDDGVMIFVLTVIATIKNGCLLLFCCCFNGCLLLFSF